MTEDELQNILNNGENISLEFKESRRKLPANLFETVCAFLNTNGGVILLGVDDGGRVKGVDKKFSANLKKDIANLSNNSQKLSPAIILNVEEVEVQGETVLVMHIPKSPHVHQTNEKIFVRNQDGDYRVTHPVEIAKIVNRKQNYYSEQKIYPNISAADFEPHLIDRAKRLIHSNNSAHHWQELDEKSFLERAGFYRKENSEKSGYTMAAILFFGTDKLIQSILPAYKFEALLRRKNVARYDDRVTVRTNLLDTYDILMGFIEKHLNDPFYLEGDIRISLRGKIFRELVVNIIAHREYMHPAQARIQILPNTIEFTNPNNPIVFGKINPEHFMPVSKNPTISKFLLQMGLVEEVGSGMRNVYKYLPYFEKGATAEFVDGEMFKTILTIGESSERFRNDFGTISERFKDELEEELVKVLRLLEIDPKITAMKLSEELKKTSRTIENYLKKLKDKNIIRRRGPKLGGYWEIMNDSKD